MVQRYMYSKRKRFVIMYVLNMIILCFYIKIKVIFRVVEIFTYTSSANFITQHYILSPARINISSQSATSVRAGQLNCGHYDSPRGIFL